MKDYQKTNIENEGTAMDVFIGRQPILNCEEEIVAYELLICDANHRIPFRYVQIQGFRRPP